MEVSYYDLLGVSEDASTADIERAYREKLKETHPDVSDREDASERTKRLIDAKETLTDPDERERYDRLGHENYVSAESVVTESTSSDETADSTTGTTTESTASAQGTGTTGTVGTDESATGRTATGAGHTAGTTTDGSGTVGGSWANPNGAGGQASTQGTTTGPAWNDRAGSSSGTGDSRTGTDRAWNRSRSYQVERGDDALRFGRALKSQRALVLLGSTFFVYPVLLFGALNDPFPLPVNLTVAMCIILVVAFLQSIPEVGIVMFGTWTALLPVLLFGLLGADPLTFRSIALLVSVAFPFGLSILTRLAIRPTSAS
jgi:molecular chaperone DnaJ